ncbi:MAG: hypothetical protein QXL75_02905 [archaeon]
MSFVWDSSSIISLSENCLLSLIPFFKTKHIITPGIYDETVHNPSLTKKHKFKALFVKEILDLYFEKQNPDKLTEKTEDLLNLVNNIFYYGNKPVKILQKGEAEVLALGLLTRSKIFVIDERTTRSLIEEPFYIQKIIENKLNIRLKAEKEKLEELNRLFMNFEVVRSADLFAYAYSKGFMSNFGLDGLESGLWAIKFAGCSISEKEIQDYLSCFSRLQYENKI